MRLSVLLQPSLFLAARPTKLWCTIGNNATQTTGLSKRKYDGVFNNASIKTRLWLIMFSMALIMFVGGKVGLVGITMADSALDATYTDSFGIFQTRKCARHADRNRYAKI